MRLGGRIAAAIEIIADIETRYRPAGDALRDWGLSHRFAGAKDRSAIGNIVYDTLRHRASARFVFGQDSPRAAVLGTMFLHWKLGAAEINAAFGVDPHAPERISPEEERALSQHGLADAPDHVRADIPAWVAPRFHATFGEDWVAEGAELAARPPLDMRANALKAAQVKVLAVLDKFAATGARYAPEAVRIAPTEGESRHPNVEVEPAFQKGWFEIQDAGSQIAARLVGAKAGEQVLDLCAGGGGKSLALAAIMGNKGQIFATDNDRARLAPIFDRLKRAGTRNVQVRPAGEALADLADRMDRVVVDAPCTGSGTWRRHPDAKWRLSEHGINERGSQQRAILASAAAYVRPGGTLTYVTCSVFQDENEDQIAAFLGEQPGWRLLSAEENLALAGLPPLAVTALARMRQPGGGILLSPRRTSTDGFFIATLERAA
ncbi:MAG: RsmB/NOP family class I SAM-dependent RNA methyltransferase [Bauldia sp.]